MLYSSIKIIRVEIKIHAYLYVRTEKSKCGTMLKKSDRNIRLTSFVIPFHVKAIAFRVKFDTIFFPNFCHLVDLTVSECINRFNQNRNQTSSEIITSRTSLVGFDHNLKNETSFPVRLGQTTYRYLAKISRGNGEKSTWGRKKELRKLEKKPGRKEDRTETMKSNVEEDFIDCYFFTKANSESWEIMSVNPIIS